MHTRFLTLAFFLWVSSSEAASLTAHTGQTCMDVELLQSGWLRASYRVGEECTQTAFPASPYILESAINPLHPEVQTQANQQIMVSESLRVTLDTSTLCLRLYDTRKQREVTQFCPGTGEQGWFTLAIDKGKTNQLYGLGQEHPALGTLDGDWLQRGKRTAGSRWGNQMVDAQGGLVGNTQFPILYALGKDATPWAVFLDNPYPQNWDFQSDPFKVGIHGGKELRFYARIGESLADLRRNYMQLVGKPLVPNRKLFGLWLSEYGYDDWAEVDAVSQSLQQHGFPLDGMVMDLQWFGGIQTDSADSHMGSLAWDETHFPHPAAKIQQLAARQLGLVLIEESYVSKNLPEHQTLQTKGYLVKQPDGQAVYLAKKPWWGKGGMLDWTNPAAGAFWHDWKRQPLIDMGILGHWTDLGEPMDYSAEGIYHGFYPNRTQHGDVHNLYNLLWHRSIFDGYQRNHSTHRPFMLSRAGAPGMQRYGGGMWSGDIPARLGNLAAHLNTQMEMSLSGIDYFSADTGGFYRSAFEGKPADYGNLYTRWLAVAALIDLPLRPHTDNACNCNPTAPDKVGDTASNLANVRLRYTLLPYYYALAHRAHERGEPIIAPALYADENDPNLRGMGGEKLIGNSLLVALATKPDTQTLRVYLPHGEWFDYRSHAWYSSKGEWLENVPLVHDQRYQLPLFARAGAIIPEMEVGNDSVDAFGRKFGNTEKPSLLKLHIFPAHQASTFTVYEDDGETTAYLQGQIRTTQIRQQREENAQHVWIDAAQGSYTAAPAQRDVQITLAEIAPVATVTVDDKPLAAQEASGFGWQRTDSNTVSLRIPALTSQQAHRIDIRYAAKEVK